MAFEAFKFNRAAKKEEKKIKKEEKLAKTLEQANAKRMDLAERSEKARAKVEAGTTTSEYLDKEKLQRDIRTARQNLFVQRDKLVKRMINFNREYRYILDKPDSPKKAKELERCSTGAKNAAYALAVVENAIDRLDDIPSEYEWKGIMRDLTKGYKAVNAMSVGSDLMTRLAFWMQKAKMDMKGNISVHAMEHYYGKPIDQLLEQEHIDCNAAQMLVKDEALSLEDEDEIREAVAWGGIYTVDPAEVSQAVEDQSVEAEKNGTEQIVENVEETFSNTSEFDMDAALGSRPSNF